MTIDKKAKNKERSDTNKESYFKKVKNRYDNGKILYTELNKLPDAKSHEYLQKELNKKFAKNVKFKCVTCAKNLLYYDEAVSDDELLDLPNVKKL